MAIKLSDIAKLAGTSSSTVSLALNNKPGVSEEVRARVKQIADELGYNRSKPQKVIPAAEELVCFLRIAKHGHTVNRDHDIFIADYIDGLSQECKRLNLNLQILSFSSVPVDKVVVAMHDHPAAGFIVLGTELDIDDVRLFGSLDKACVFLDLYEDFLPFDFVDMNNKDSIFALLSYLYGKGHREIGFVRGTFQTPNFSMREEAFRQGLARQKLAFNDKYIFTVDQTFHGAYRDMKKILGTAPPLPTALVCDNDIIACGCLKAIKEHGIKVPEDLSIVGFDNLPLSSVVDPPLTTIEVSKAQIGRTAIELLYRRIHATSALEATKVLISGSLVERGSVADLRGETPDL